MNERYAAYCRVYPALRSMADADGQSGSAGL